MLGQANVDASTNRGGYATSRAQAGSAGQQLYGDHQCRRGGFHGHRSRLDSACATYQSCDAGARLDY